MSRDALVYINQLHEVVDSPRAMDVLKAIAAAMDERGKACLTYRQLEAMVGLRERRLRMLIRHLQGKGVLLVTTRKHGRSHTEMTYRLPGMHPHNPQGLHLITSSKALLERMRAKNEKTHEIINETNNRLQAAIFLRELQG